MDDTQAGEKITLPLPPKILSPNARPHWAAKARAVKQYRGYARLTAMATGRRPCWELATAQAVFYFAVARRRDRDNFAASLKAAADGLVDGGLLKDDAGLVWLPVRFETDKADPRVEIFVVPGLSVPQELSQEVRG